MREVTTFYLEMKSPDDLNAKPSPVGLKIMEVETKDYHFNRHLYKLVGKQWYWEERLSYSDAEWRQYAEDDNLRTWVAYSEGAIAGYFELQKEENRDIKIAIFGLVPDFIGRGLGGYVLTCAIQSAWSWGETERVWVHTCSLDHEVALSNYQDRGMRLYKTVIESNSENELSLVG